MPRKGARRPAEGRDPGRPALFDPERLRRNAFALLLTRLGRRDHTETELRRALTAKGFPDAVIEATLDQARGEGLVDDARLASRIAHFTARSGKRGPRRVVATLRQKGVSAETARAAAKEAFAASEEGEGNLVRFAARLLERAKGATRADRRARVVRSLLGRGFELSEANRALRLAETALMAENTGNDRDADPEERSPDDRG